MSPDGDDRDWLHLDAGERVVWASRPHPIELGRGFVVAAFATLVAATVTTWGLQNGHRLVGWAGALLFVGGVALVAGRYLRWTSTRYVITTNELYEKRGVVSREVTRLALDRVQNASLRQSVAGRLLGYGDLAVYSAGSGDPEVTFVRAPNPGEASTAISTRHGRAERMDRR